ncbi:helix-turn-helix domain-containing protein [Bacillus sp. NEB1478]|uniref:helix-turn-helix domain-containing protein n=1 Tax=Bacillus sp. NEB1478 TaxID=3073816 RepID=UPI002873D07F|nr:helix-turn-helix domain-containing protein [Bacillus sp. NEB1478]WNB93957.1 helix-turn-helix domain-containing protein [Bacillus sp. NEB1478]
MNICNTIILNVLREINGSRKWSGVYYILTGKKTSQSLSDSQWFGLEPYYSSLKGISIVNFQEELERLLHLNWIETKGEEDKYFVTELGVSALEAEKERFIFLEKLNGLKYSSIDRLCWQVISLYCQALSNSIYGFKKYSPIVRERFAVQQVKEVFPKSAQNRETVAKQLFSELFLVLSEADGVSAEVFVRKLSGYDRIGFTYEQIAEELDLTKLECMLRFRAVLHQLISLTDQDPESFPVLFSLISMFIAAPPLTNSASLTYELLRKKKSISEIMRIRRLKMSTLEDHLVEIARTIPSFSIQPFISEEEIKQVVTYFYTNKENKLRPIKEAFPHLSYLQIRLVLAKEGGSNGT